MENLKTSSDVLFILMGAVMVLAMHAGFAFLELGTVRRKNQVNALIKILSDFSVSTVGYFFITWSYRLLDISALQPITFLGIVWAALMDVAVWGKTSDLWTFVGAAIIVAATSYIAHREAVAGGKKA